MGGRELVQRLLESRPTMKVLYLSGYTEDAVASDKPKKSDKTFLQKPFTLQNLCARCGKCWGRSRGEQTVFWT